MNPTITVDFFDPLEEPNPHKGRKSRKRGRKDRNGGNHTSQRPPTAPLQLSQRPLSPMTLNQTLTIRVYEAPYHGVFSEIFGRGDAYEILKARGLVEFMDTSFLRGITIKDAVIVVDELQNMRGEECNTIMSRIGDGCRVIFCGDYKQNDLIKRDDRSGMVAFTKILEEMKSFRMIDFGPQDVVRSGLVKEYILTRDDLEERGVIDLQTTS